MLSPLHKQWMDDGVRLARRVRGLIGALPQAYLVLYIMLHADTGVAGSSSVRRVAVPWGV